MAFMQMAPEAMICTTDRKGGDSFVESVGGALSPGKKVQAPMKLREFIVTDAIVPSLIASDREGAIRELVLSLEKAGALPQEASEEIIAEVIKREQRGSTGLGKGVAVPHAKNSQIKRIVSVIGRSPGGIDFSALDHQPVYSVVLLLSPSDHPELHLSAMNIIFSNLQKDTFRRFLRQAATREAIVELLDEADQGK